jgi:hypothetical protein
MAAACDADGWSYAFDFPEFALPAAVFDKPNGATFVRRRRWAREWAETDVPGSQLRRHEAGDAREEDRGVEPHSHKLDRALLGSGAALPSHDPSDVRLGISVVEEDPFEDRGDDDDGLPAIGVISVEPTVSAASFESLAFVAPRHASLRRSRSPTARTTIAMFTCRLASARPTTAARVRA